jgi:protein arginine N-methyltransferase 2
MTTSTATATTKMIEACSSGDTAAVLSVLLGEAPADGASASSSSDGDGGGLLGTRRHLLASSQDEVAGLSDDAVMMEWERPIMEAHASVLTHGGISGKRVLNVRFGLGIVDTALQSHDPSLHVIIEAHPTVYAKMMSDGWDMKPNVIIRFGRWQDEMPKLIAEGGKFDGVFYDTYGEHFTGRERRARPSPSPSIVHFEVTKGHVPFYSAKSFSWEPTC